VAADQDLAWTLVTAVERIHELENELGCFFDRNPDGSMHQKAFAGQTFDRTVHKGDLTGIEIINRLAEQVWARGIAGWRSTAPSSWIKTARRRRAGRRADDRHAQGGFVFVQAKAVLLATGGGPTMYKYHTPSGDKSCDGLAMALRAGLPLRDMEMVQFHPTGLLAGSGTRMTGTVLEEGLRGAGGYLLNGAGERFMSRATTRAPSAPRATSSRAPSSRDARRPHHAQRRRLHPDAHLGPDKVRQQFKGMVERCADCGFDLAGGLVEVVPTAHYMMGGVVFAPTARTPLPGLFAPARTPAACTAPTAWAATAWPTPPCSAASPATPWPPGCGARALARARRGRHRRRHRRARGALRAGPGRRPGAVREALYDCMWDDVGILRTATSLQRALQRCPSWTRSCRAPAWPTATAPST
jgi:fumarate reductase flavoprotein subunit